MIDVDRPRPHLVFELSILTVGAVSTLGVAVTGALAWDAGLPREGLAAHLLLALLWSMGVLLPHPWFVLYLAGTGRALAAAAGDGGPPALAAVRRARRAAVPALLLAVAAVVALALTGAAGYTRNLDPLWHRGLFFALLVLQPLALAAEWRALKRNAELLASLGG